MSNYKLKYSGEKIDEILTKADGMSEVVTATGETAGKVKLSDATDSESDVSAGVAATPKAVKAAYDAASDAGKAAGDLNTKVEENTTSISENATAIGKLEKDIDNLSSSKISKFYASSQGNTNLPDSDNGKIIDLKLYGKSSQQQYSGKNLLDATEEYVNINGISLKKLADGTYKLSGTASAMSILNITKSIDNVFGGARLIGSPALSSDSTYFLWATYLDSNDVEQASSEYSTTDTGVLLSSDYPKILIRIVIREGVNANNGIIFKPMITKDLTATYADYEPYVGGIHSPNPEYPQEIKSVVKPVVKVTSQNYLEYKDAGGGVTAPVTLAKGDHYLTRFFLTSNTEVNNTVEYFSDGTWKAFSSVGSLENGKIVVSESTFGWYAEHMKIVCTENITIRVGISRDSVITLNDYGYLDKYAEYKAPQTVTLPYTLNAIPVTSGGNVTIDGQQYIADYVDVERGKLIQKNFKYKITGNENIYAHNSGWIYVDTGLKMINEIGLSNVATLTTYSSILRGQLIRFGRSGVYFTYNDTFTDVDTFKAYVKNTDVYIIAALQEPIETDLTAEEIAAFKALVSYYPVTNVSTTSDQLDGYTVFNYPISLANGWNYIKQQLGDTRDYLYGIDLMTAEAYVNSEYAAALAEIEV